MKKVSFIILLVALALGAGFASVRLRASPAFKPHTIVYRLISYDESGKSIQTSVLIRRVLSDGTWNHTQINQEGPPVYSNGKLKREVTSRTAEATMPEHLGFKYIHEKGHDSEGWISPELQDCLMFATYFENGSKQSVLEAVNVSLP
ncbi:MAG TPA: hypothetical protein VM656_05425 [Pyrinomonadaceae bacterium]|jgi:hypothetical protein|nr:hypothetical protein [Pyrinomonadaceae bacterium]